MCHAQGHWVLHQYCGEVLCVMLKDTGYYTSTVGRFCVSSSRTLGITPVLWGGFVCQAQGHRVLHQYCGEVLCVMLKDTGYNTSTVGRFCVSCSRTLGITPVRWGGFVCHAQGHWVLHQYGGEVLCVMLKDTGYYTSTVGRFCVSCSRTLGITPVLWGGFLRHAQGHWVLHQYCGEVLWVMLKDTGYYTSTVGRFCVSCSRTLGITPVLWGGFLCHAQGHWVLHQYCGEVLCVMLKDTGYYTSTVGRFCVSCSRTLGITPVLWGGFVCHAQGHWVLHQYCGEILCVMLKDTWHLDPKPPPSLVINFVLNYIVFIL